MTDRWTRKGRRGDDEKITGAEEMKTWGQEETKKVNRQTRAKKQEEKWTRTGERKVDRKRLVSR